MKPFTDITVLLDRSGSMSDIKFAMEEVFNTFVKGHREVPSTKMTLIQFDTVNKQEIVFQGVPISSVETLNFQPRGGTPLNDAFVTAIDNTGSRLRNLPESERPDQVLFVVITDGAENASTQFKRQDVFDRVTKQSNDFKWQFIYMGANQDTFKESQGYGISWNNTLKYSPNLDNMKYASQALVGTTVSYTASVGATRGQQVNSFTRSSRVKSATLADLQADTIDITTTPDEDVI